MPEPADEPLSELVETGGGWRPCPGGPAINVDTERWVAQCPHCDYTFSTLMDEPVVPPHYVSLNGEAVMFLMPSDRNDPPLVCAECGHPATAHQSAVDRRSGPCSVCGCRAIGPPFNSDRDALAKLYLACLDCLSPSERRDTGLTPLLDDVGRYLGVPDAE